MAKDKADEYEPILQRYDASGNGSSKLYGDKRPPFSFRMLWRFTGPGFLMSIAYLDPGNLEGDLQAGATAGYALLWVLMWCTVIGLVLQLLAARLGVVTGLNLAQTCRVEYPPIPRYTLWVLTEIAIIASDIQEVIGSAIALQLLTLNHLPLWAGVLITAVDTFFFLFLEQGGIRKLEAFFGLLITVMVATFGVAYVIAVPASAQWDVFKGCIVPTIPSGTVVQAVALLGAVIMPHNIYLHSALVQSRGVDITRPSKIKEANFYFAIESSIALFISFIINLFVVGTFAAAFPETNSTVGLSGAGEALKAVFDQRGFVTSGAIVFWVWSSGLLASGQASTMTGTYAGQFVMQGFMEWHMPPWKRVAITRTIAIVPAVVVALVSSNHLDELGEYLNTLQSVQLPFALLPVLQFTNSRRIMGEFVNPLWMKVLTWMLTVLVLAVNVYLIYGFTANFPNEVYVWLPIGVVGLLYFLFIFYLCIGPAKFARMCNFCNRQLIRHAPGLVFWKSNTDLLKNVPVEYEEGGELPLPRPHMIAGPGYGDDHVHEYHHSRGHVHAHDSRSQALPSVADSPPVYSIQ